MRRSFLLNRLIDLVIVLFGVSLVAFLLIHLVPGDAVTIMLGANTEVTPERVAELRARLGLDQPVEEEGAAHVTLGRGVPMKRITDSLHQDHFPSEALPSVASERLAMMSKPATFARIAVKSSP